MQRIETREVTLELIQDMFSPLEGTPDGFPREYEIIDARVNRRWGILEFTIVYEDTDDVVKKEQEEIEQRDAGSSL